MKTEFVAPCVEEYGCNPFNLLSYANDNGIVEFLQCCDCELIWNDLTKGVKERVFNEAYFHEKTFDAKREHRVNKAHMFLSILEQYVSPGKLLEVGPALGYNLEAAMQRGWDVNGFDISDYVIGVLEEMNIPIEKASLCDNDKPDGVYDAILLKHMLEHYRNPFDALIDANRLLKDNGYLQAFLPNAKYKIAVKERGKFRFYNHKENGIEHFVYFTQDTLNRMLEHSGFEIVQENFPVFVKGDFSVGRIIDRFGRRLISKFDLDQELMVIAKKK